MTNFDLIPMELRQYRQWLCWKFGPLDLKTGKRRKIPINPHTGGNAKCNDETTWASFHEVEAAITRLGCSGRGFVFTASDQYCGIDLDGCWNPETSTLTPEAAEIICSMNSYTEISPSGTGLKIFLRANLNGSGIKRPGFEIYSQGRYFTVTGLHFAGTPMTINEAQAAVDQLCQKYRPPAPSEKMGSNQDDERIRRCRAIADNDLIDTIHAASEKFSRLWDGDTSAHPSHSEADMALCVILVKFTGGDAERVDRLFRMSKLFRKKWDERHGEKTYGEMTVSKALSVQRELWDPQTDQLVPSGASNRTDAANAERYSRKNGDDVRYCAERKLWYVWDGRRWSETDATGKPMDLALQTARSIYEEAAHQNDPDKRKDMSRWAVASESRQRLEAMVSLVRSKKSIRVEKYYDVFDLDSWLFNCATGAVDLRTGLLGPHRRSLMMTNISPVPYIPDATCLRWETFLGEVCQGNEQLIAYMQRVIGYTLTGDTRERAIFLLYGSEGHNGKTTLINVLARLFGSYAHSAPFQEFLQKFHDGATNELAQFQGKRLVYSVEPPKGKAFNEALLKQLSGQDMIRTRSLYRESTEWKPQFKLFFAANYKPQIHETVGAIWDRVQLIPFLATFKGNKRDDQLAQKLEEELSGILAWAVRGCLEWQRIGLNPPDKVKAATSSYRAEMNNVTDFINECCVQNNDARVLASELYRRYREWAIEAGLRFPLSKKALAQELDRMGFESFRSGGKTYYRGLALASFPLDDVEPEGEF